MPKRGFKESSSGLKLLVLELGGAAKPNERHFGESYCIGEHYGSRGTVKYPVPRVALGKPALKFWEIPVYVKIYFRICMPDVFM